MTYKNRNVKIKVKSSTEVFSGRLHWI